MNLPNMALILAATKGTRMAPVSLPKCLLPVGGLPIIVHQLIAMEKVGVETAHICLETTLGQMVQRSLEKGYDGTIDLTFSYESQLRGIGYTTFINRAHVGDDFILALADEYNTSHALLDASISLSGHFLIGVTAYTNASDISAGCNVLFDDKSGNVIELIEKPKSNAILGPWCWTGFGRFNGAIFPILEKYISRNKQGEIDLTSPLRDAIELGNSVLAVKEPGINVNITTLDDYKKAWKLADSS